jgi:MSHA biogenesis protein MshO
MKARGFTLIELIVAITISSIVVIFAAMFISAPLGAYETHARRAVLVSDASGAWPRMETDLRAALPNSLRTRRNGNFVAIEMLGVIDVARYKTPTAAPFTTAGLFRGMPYDTTGLYLSVNNLGTPGADAYALSGSMTPAGTRIQIVAGALPGESSVTVTPAAAFTANSPMDRVYLVLGPVTYLCDEGQGTIRKYASYTIAANQAARDTPAEFAAAGATNELVAQGLTSCNFAVSAPGGLSSQTAAIRLTTTRNGDSVTLLHTSRALSAP